MTDALATALTEVLSSEDKWRAVNNLGDPNVAVAYGALGMAFALIFSNAGAAFGTAKSGLGIVATAAERPDLIFRSIIPVVMAGILGMYGMIIAIIMKSSIQPTDIGSISNPA